jgi:hypothetical protein
LGIFRDEPPRSLRTLVVSAEIVVAGERLPKAEGFSRSSRFRDPVTMIGAQPKSICKQPTTYNLEGGRAS